MPCIVELAELCLASYSEAETVTIALNEGEATTWTRAAYWKSGYFYAAHFTAPGGGPFPSYKQSVLAFRGTDDLYDALIDDAIIGLAGQMPPTFLAAMNIPHDDETILTGHSLGGALAILMAEYKTDASRFKHPTTVTFNAPGVMDSSEATLSLLKGRSILPTRKPWFRALMGRLSNPYVYNYRINGDPVSSFFTTGSQPGATKTISAPECGVNLLCLHGMATCVAAVRRDPKNYLDGKYSMNRFF